jgi:hypothetical protein
LPLSILVIQARKFDILQKKSGKLIVTPDALSGSCHFVQKGLVRGILFLIGTNDDEVKLGLWFLTVELHFGCIDSYDFLVE